MIGYSKGLITGTQQRGFSLIEAAIVLGIVGLVIGGIWVAASAVSSRMNVSRVEQAYLTITENARHLFPISSYPATSVNYTFQESVLAAAGGFPADLIKNGSPVGPWGGSITVNLGNDATNWSGQFLSVNISMPRTECIQVVQWLLGRLSPDNMFGIFTSDSPTFVTMATINTPRTITNVQNTACTSTSGLIQVAPVFTPQQP